jgi:hypothetical protein
MSGTKSPLQELAARISANTDVITTYCKENGYSQRSFELGSPAALLPAGVPTEIREKQQELLDAAAELQILATDASEFLNRLAVQVRQKFVSLVRSAL